MKPNIGCALNEGEIDRSGGNGLERMLRVKFQASVRNARCGEPTVTSILPAEGQCQTRQAQEIAPKDNPNPRGGQLLRTPGPARGLDVQPEEIVIVDLEAQGRQGRAISPTAQNRPKPGRHRICRPGPPLGALAGHQVLLQGLVPLARGVALHLIQAQRCIVPVVNVGLRLAAQRICSTKLEASSIDSGVCESAMNCRQTRASAVIERLTVPRFG